MLKRCKSWHENKNTLEFLISATSPLISSKPLQGAWSSRGGAEHFLGLGFNCCCWWGSSHPVLQPPQPRPTLHTLTAEIARMGHFQPVIHLFLPQTSKTSRGNCSHRVLYSSAVRKNLNNQLQCKCLQCQFNPFLSLSAG